MRRTALTAALLTIVAVHGVLWWIDSHPRARPPWGDEQRYLDLARATREGSAADRDPLWPPLYERFVAGLLVGSGSIVALQAAQTALLLLVALLLYDLTRRAGGSPVAGAIAAVLALTYPPLAAFAHYVWPEILHMAFVLCAVTIFVRRPASLPWLALGGVLLGSALLTKHLLWPFLPLLLWPVARHGGRRAGAVAVALVLLALAATVAPPLIAEYRRTGVVGAVASADFNLWVGLHERSRRAFTDDVAGRAYDRWVHDGTAYPERTAALASETRELLRRRGLIAVLRAQLGRQYFRWLDKDSFFTDQLPGGVLARRGQGYAGVPHGLAEVLRWLSYVLYGAVLAGAALGLTVYRPRVRGFWLIDAFLLYNALLFLFVHVKTRHRVQLLPLLFLLCGLGVSGLLQRRRRATPAVGRRAWMAALSLTAALWFLAFAGGRVR